MSTSEIPLNPPDNETGKQFPAIPEVEALSFEEISARSCRHGMSLTEFVAFEAMKCLMGDQSGLPEASIAERSWKISDFWEANRLARVKPVEEEPEQ